MSVLRIFFRAGCRYYWPSDQQSTRLIDWSPPCPRALRYPIIIHSASAHHVQGGRKSRRRRWKRRSVNLRTSRPLILSHWMTMSVDCLSNPDLKSETLTQSTYHWILLSFACTNYVAVIHSRFSLPGWRTIMVSVNSGQREEIIIF